MAQNIPIELALQHSLQKLQGAFCRSNKTSVLGTILVDHNDLRSNQERIQTQQNLEAGYPVHRLARILIPGRPLKAIVLQKWITAELLVAKRYGRMRIVSPAEMNRFRKIYCLADEVCSILGISRTTLSRWEEVGLITAVYSRRGHEGAGTSVFLREEIERLDTKGTTTCAETISKVG